MAAVPLFRDTNMAAVTSRENTLLIPVIPINYIYYMASSASGQDESNPAL